MQHKTKFLSLLLTAIIFACAEKQNEELNNRYILKGSLDGIENQTWIYLSFENKVTDSTQISENKFEFTGELNHPKLFNLYTKYPQNSTSIWLDTGLTTFEAKNEKFREAKIIGSKSQTESEQLRSAVKDYRKHRDSLTQIAISTIYNDSIKKIANEALKVIYASHLEIETDFVKKNPKSYVSVWFVDHYSTTLGRTKTQELFNALDDSLKQSSYGERITHYLNINVNPKIGDSYVNFSMTNNKGELINLSDYNGKLLLLDFWASWCGPCKEEYPALKEAYAKFHDKGFEIVSISQDQNREDWINAIETNGLNWVNLWDASGNNADPYLIYDINGIPDNFLIDKNGIIVARDLRGKELISTIKKNL